jgi:hypothetical protein
VADEDGFASPFDDDLGRENDVSDVFCLRKLEGGYWRTFFPSGIADKSTSTLA